MNIQEKIEVLQHQGVEIPAPQTLEIGDEVKLDQIRGPGTTLHGGTKLFGADLLIFPGARLGYEEPVTVENCAVGRGVKLNGGYFAGSVFLDGVVMGKGAQVRSGTLMEEEANGAHTVGLKQTILLPFVTLGSLINFCDILMAGGTSRKDHSEVGSSFIHFNYTPFGRNGDKATPSLIGDVPRGVMLRSKRIFLGGQAGLVGPLSVDYGTVLAAGAVYRRDYGPDLLAVGEKLVTRTLPFTPLRYGRTRTKVEKNLRYLGNLAALWHWYDRVRLYLARSDHDLLALYRRGQIIISECINERIQRLGQVAGYMEDSVRELKTASGEDHQKEIEEQRAFARFWPEMERGLLTYKERAQAQTNTREFEQFHSGLEQAALKAGQDGYLAVIRAFSEETLAAGTSWLNAIVENTVKLQGAVSQ